MGNQTSTNNPNSLNKEQSDKLQPKSISQILDYIATYYILTMDFKSLRKLYDKEHCDKLVILTSEIIQRYFTDLEITYLSQRIKDGVEVNENAKDKVIFFNRDMLGKLDIQNSIKKKRICLSIAKFYIKIAHIFAAIVTTINPIYVYKDADGNTVRASLYEKGTIPKNTPRDIYKLNICDNRINSLQNKQSLEPDINGEITVGPKVCSMNIGDDGQPKNLDEEPGIPELEELYYDDNYDFKTGKFMGMSENTRKVFLSDLQIFYNIFTGNTNQLPPEITRFSDIKLRDYHKMDKCKGSNPLFERKYKGPLTNKLFRDYAENLKKMIQTANKNQDVLLTIINQIFVYTIDPQTGKKQIRINPLLTEDRLQEIVVETRALIIKLYLTCEIDYVNGLKMYEAIVEQKILETAQNQISKLENISEQLIIEDSIPEPAEVKEMKDKAEEKIAEDKQKLEKQAEEIKNAEEVVDKNPSAVLKENIVIKKEEESNMIKENTEDKQKVEL
jgi:ElaB/YqjD/DUF883 family membrane-anchored ribosome-binding protein